jgi:hypothetical protein
LIVEAAGPPWVRVDWAMGHGQWEPLCSVLLLERRLRIRRILPLLEYEDSTLLLERDEATRKLATLASRDRPGLARRAIKKQRANSPCGIVWSKGRCRGKAMLLAIISTDASGWPTSKIPMSNQSNPAHLVSYVSWLPRSLNEEVWASERLGFV